MKIHFKSLLILLFVGILIFLSYQITSKINHKNEIAQNIKTVPEFSYKNIKGGIFSNQNLKKENATIFIYFNTECEFCNEEAKMIKDNIKSLKNFQLIFVSFEKPENIKLFSQKHQLSNYDNVYFLCDSKVTFASTFDVTTLPCLVLYDKNFNLLEKIKGQTKPEILIKKLEIE